MDPYREIVDTWLLEDKTRPKKQRHTAQRIYDRLVAEHHFPGSARTVRYYVAKRKTELQLEQAESYIRLEHPGGEAQVDFGSFQAVIGGKPVERKMLLLSYPYSNAAFVFVTPKENKECFLEGLKRLFEMSGGVPTRIWFDNLSAAVVSVEPAGKRILTEDFERFSLHYRFTPVFCNPGKGNEKGHVENKVGYVRRNWCVPLPEAPDLEGLQAQLAQKAINDRANIHYAKGLPQGELWEQEKQKLQALPPPPFEAYRLERVKTNAYGEIIVDQRAVKVPIQYAGESLWLKVWWDRIQILNEEYDEGPGGIGTSPYPWTFACISNRSYENHGH
jgi:transposase